MNLKAIMKVRTQRLRGFTYVSGDELRDRFRDDGKERPAALTV